MFRSAECQIEAYEDVNIQSQSSHYATSVTKTRGGGLIPIGDADAEVTVQGDAARTVIGKANITAKESANIQSQSAAHIDAQASTKSYGLGTSSNAESRIVGAPFQTLVDVRSDADIKAKTVNLNTTAVAINTNASARAKGVGLGSLVKAEATVAVGSNAQVTLGEDATVTGISAVNIQSHHGHAASQAHAKAKRLSLFGKKKAKANNDLVTNSAIVTEPESTIRTPELTVQSTIGGANGVSSVNRSIDFNSDITSEPNPVLEIDELGHVVRACNVTIDDPGGVILDPTQITLAQDGIALGPIQSDDVVVNDILNDAVMDATFHITPLSDDNGAEMAKDNSTGVIKGNPRFLETYDRVDIINRSNKDVVINNMDVINTTIPIITVTGATPAERQGVFAIDPVGPRLPRLLGTTTVEVQNQSDSDVIFNGVIFNPHDVTTITNTGGHILSQHNDAMIQTRDLNLVSNQGQIGTEQDRVTAQLIQDYAVGEGYGEVAGKDRDPELIPNSELTAIADHSVYLDVQGIRRDEDPLVIHSDRLSTSVNDHNNDVNVRIRQGIAVDENGDRTPTHSTYKFDLVQSGDDIILDADRSDTTFNGNTNILATGKLDIVTGNDVDLTEIEGPLDIRQVHSDTGDITLSVKDSIATGENLILDSEATVKASEGDVNLRAGDDIVMAREATLIANDTASLEGDYGNADTGAGTKSFIRGMIDALTLRFIGNADGDRVDLTDARYTESIVELQDGDDVFEGGHSPDQVEGGDGNDSLNGHGGNDQLNGNVGIDELSGGEGSDTLSGGTGHDTLNGDGDGDRLIGGEGNDALNGGEGDDTLEGQNGKDTLVGNAGNDHLIGGDDRDILRGDDGDDRLNGGIARDILIGGQGADEFPSDAQDIERDFDETVDIRINFS